MNLPEARNGDCCCCVATSSSSPKEESSSIIYSSSDLHQKFPPSTSPTLNSKRGYRNRRLVGCLLRRHIISGILVVVLSLHVTLCSTVEIPMYSNSYLNGGSETSSGSSTPQAPFQEASLNGNIPTGSSSSLNNVIVPGPSSPSVQAGVTSPSVPQSYFINGYANLIQRLSVAELRAYGKNQPFQLQFRTVCPFGNIVNDDKFALRFSSSGFLTYLHLPQEVQVHRSQSVVADGHWHSVTFKGSQIDFDDTKTGDNYGTSIDISNNFTDAAHHTLNFFDGFVGCIRTQPSSNLSSSGGEVPVYDELFKSLSKQGYQPCNDPQFDLSSAQCFLPESFVLCSKCQNNATCMFTDGKNECLCPETENEVLHPPFCSSHEPEEHSEMDSDLSLETRELLHGGMEEHDEHSMSSTTGSSKTSSMSHSSALMPSTTEHMAASSSVEQSRAPPEPPVCPCIRGQCVQENNGSWSCDCDGTGFRGRTCNNDVCDANPGVCGSFGKCFDDPLSEPGFECFCKPGYAGDLCNINFNECLSNPCVNNGTCEDGVNTYTCRCEPGYTGKNCETEINECDSSPCENGGVCDDLVADYSCNCLAGFEGKTCGINIDECKPQPCQNKGICVDGIADYSCQCDETGFMGKNCEVNIDDCNPEPCVNMGNCTDGIKDYTCSCFPGYEGKNCETDIPECHTDNSSGDSLNMNGPCRNGGACFERSDPENYGYTGPLVLQHLEFDYSSAAGYVCSCLPGYTGDNCEIDINECELSADPCSGQGLCVDMVNAYRCECRKGFEGEHCEIDINECDPSPCQEAKECHDLAGDYECQCTEGYGGKNCTVALTGCIKNICYNEGACKPLYEESTDEHSFECSCKSGFTGTTCETRTTMAFNGSSLAEILKNDDAFLNNKYFLSFSFRTTLPDVILAVGVGGTYFSLGLVGGKLNLQSSLINSLQGMSSGSNLHDGSYHKVVVSINQTHAILSAGIEQVTLPIADSEDFAQQPTGFNTTILGDLKPNLAFLNKLNLDPFVGCMRDVLINSDRILPEEAENVNLTNIVPVCSRKDQCNPSPCLNGGTCTDLWQKFTCNCPRPHLGSRCQYSYTAATFNHEETNNSLAIVDIPPRRFGGVFDISMFVRTRESRGTIFLLCDKEKGLNGSFIEATITKNGNLVVQAKWVSESNGDDNVKPEPYTVDGTLTDGNYHLISVQRDKTHVVIKVNDSEHFRKSHSNKPFTPTVMYIGGKPSHLSGLELAVQPISESHASGETSTNLPDTIDNNTEGSTQDAESESEVITVPFQYQFKGIIQDVKVNLSGAEQQLPPGFGHSSQSFSKEKNLYVVEFFSLNLTDSVQPSPSLGRVTIQGLKQGEVSDEMCRNQSTSLCFRGTCRTTWNDFRCDCWDPEEYAGKLCDIRLRCADVKCPERSKCRNIGYTGFECVADAAFDGKGRTTPHYILKSNSLADLTFNEVSFRYRSKKPGNIIHMSNQSSFLRVSLEGTVNDGSIVFWFINDQKIVIQNSTVFDGEWHSVSLKFSTIDNSDYKNTVGLVFDRFENQTEFMYHSHQYLRDIVISPSLDIVVGSSLSLDMSDMGHHSHSQYYRGCLNNIHIGDYRLPFVSPSRLRELNPATGNISLYIETTAPTAFFINERYHPQEQQLPPLGCTLCYEKDCKNGGHCSDPTQLYDCSCMSGYMGETCDIDIDECVDNRCSHGSTCIDGINNYTCACPRGYDGRHCDHDIDECEGGGEDKCNFNGQCVDEIGEFKCLCSDDYTGLYCEKRKKSTCKDDPCEHGSCHDVGLQANGVSFRCDCDQGYEGEFCSEKIDYCKNVTCLNNGGCSNTVFGARCQCEPGFDGRYCEADIDECKQAPGGNPCKNGGECIDQINSFQCDCTDTGFEGTYCEEDIDECAINPYICADHLHCENIIGHYICFCTDRFKCGPSCDIRNPCFDEEGNNYTCHNGGTCDPVCDDPEMSPFAKCRCPPEFTGDLCEQAANLKRPADESTVDILLIIIPVLAAILIAATIGIIILVRMARRKRATRGVYSPSQQEYCNPRVELDNVMKPPPEERLI